MLVELIGHHKSKLRNAMKDFSEAYPDEENYKLTFDYAILFFIFEDDKTV